MEGETMKTAQFGYVMAAVMLTVMLSCGTAPAARFVVNMTQSRTFDPPALGITLGDTIVWRNVSTLPHTSTSGNPCIGDGLWNSGTLASGDSFSLVLASVGTYPYFCVFHCDFGMTGTITVSAAGVTDGVPQVSLSRGMRLMQNRPNPFYPTTLIDYTVDQPGNAGIRIFNEAGELVRDLIEGYKPKGRYTILWDGRNNHGEASATGVYVYQLTVNERKLEKRMIKLK
jgi:plastocyanin